MQLLMHILKRNFYIMIYGNKELYLIDYEVVIMDYGKSSLNPANKIEGLFRNINNFLLSFSSCLNDKNIFWNYNNSKIRNILLMDDSIYYFDEIEKIIDLSELILISK